MDRQDFLRISRRTECVMFSIRIDKALADYYDELASKTNRSRNELIQMALEYAKERITID